jgi:putative transferase (TIGR04331 family)
VLFLGEWCRRYARRELWQQMDAVVAAPYGIALDEKQRDHIHVAELCDRVLPQLAALLNEQHGVKHSVRYWRIVLGHWLQRCFALLVNRWFSLQQALSRHQIAGARILEHGAYELATDNSLAFIYASNDDAWNHVLYARILSRLGVPCERAGAVLTVENRFHMGAAQASRSDGGRTARLRQAVDATLRALSRDTDAVIVNSYLPRAEAAKLQLQMGQVPRVWRFPAAPSAPADVTLRTQLGGLLTDRLRGRNEFETFAYEQTFAMLPTCFLEGYEQLSRSVSATSLPRRPRFIYTCSNFDTDESFKLWAAGKADEGVPYFTGQHGSNYGTMEYCPSERECTATSDSFFTWGWADGPRYVPAFMFKLAGQKRPVRGAAENLLLIELRIRNRVDTWDNDAEFCRYQNNQFRFAEGLPEKIRERLVVRLHAAHEKNFWSDAERWRDRAPTVRLDGGSADLWEMIAGSRLVVHSYNSTGIVELLALNIPVMCFWDDSMEVLRDSAAPFYDALERVGIFSRTPEVAARRVMEVWDRVDQWWNSDDVQRARMSYCERYGRVVDKPLGLMRRQLAAAVARAGAEPGHGISLGSR